VINWAMDFIVCAGTFWGTPVTLLLQTSSLDEGFLSAGLPGVCVVGADLKPETGKRQRVRYALWNTGDWPQSPSLVLVLFHHHWQGQEMGSEVAG
jgi:hypothetical protein